MLTKMIDGKKIKLTSREENEVIKSWKEADKITKKYGYRDPRSRAYPPVGDQLDSLFKIIKLLKGQGVNIGVDGQKWLDQLQSVKDKYPKN